MDRLPEELVSYVFTFLAAANSLSPAMLVNQQWYMYGARNLHHRVVLNLAPGLTVSSADTAISFMKRLVSPTLSTAHFIHHLVLSGFANLDVQELILNILGRASALRSLNMHSLHIIPGGIWIPPDVFSSDVFLPNLIALNTSSVQFCARLCRDRRLTSIRIHEKIGSTHLDQLLSPARHSAPKLERLELVVAVDNASSAVARMAELASALATAPLCALSLQFILDHPGPVPWIEFEVRPTSDLCRSCGVPGPVTHGLRLFPGSSARDRGNGILTESSAGLTKPEPCHPSGSPNPRIEQRRGGAGGPLQRAVDEGTRGAPGRGTRVGLAEKDRAAVAWLDNS